MKIAFDTSVLVPALVRAHPFHLRAHPWLAAVVAGPCTGVVSWHALAECWAVLTRLPLQPRLSPEQTRQVLDRLRQHVEMLEIPGQDYEQALERCAAASVTSGGVFDALHLVAARRALADVLVTFNPDDFTRVVVAGDPQIVTPPDPPRFEIPAVATFR